MERKNVRNVAIIAHVDHGKTTLVDGLLKSTGIFRENQAVDDRVMDSDDIEKERGITILSKNTAVDYNGYKINIIDTPGHADFGGEVERVLGMADGAILVIDSFEGPMPQTKFVLGKAFDHKLPLIICINKIDRPDARIEAVKDELLDLLLQMDADEEYLDSPTIYASAKSGFAIENLDDEKADMRPLLDTIVKWIPEPSGEIDKPFKLLISTTDYSEYVGKIGIGKIDSGEVHKGDNLYLVNSTKPDFKKKIHLSEVFEFEGLKRVEVENSSVGNLVAVTGIDDLSIGDTLVSGDDLNPLPFNKISEPTLSITISVNNGPLAGKEGDFVTSRQLRDRLYKELQTDVSLRVEDTDSPESFKVSGRGELHLSVLLENMRREGYEFLVSKPEVLFKVENNKKLEPMELVTIDVDEAYMGSIIEKLGNRKGLIQQIKPSNSGFTRIEILIPTRGLVGYRTEFMTDTKGNGIMNSEFQGYDSHKGDIPRRKTGSIVAFESGTALAYGLNVAQKRGQLFIEPGVEVYSGMVIGSTGDGLDVEVNVTKGKKQTNIRAGASDDAIRLSPVKQMTIEELMEFIESDELIEVTPKNFRLRKRILDSGKRHKVR